jgi:hypothetical protein
MSQDTNAAGATRALLSSDPTETGFDCFGFIPSLPANDSDRFKGL